MSINKSRRRLLTQFSLASAALSSGVFNSAHAQSKNGKPNIVFILADDLGYADLGVFGARHIKTPNLDKLAKEGVLLTDAYSNSPVCSATRFGLITGRYQYRLRGGLEEPLSAAAGNLGLPADHPTLPSLLRMHGYKTALFGKWHLGSLPDYGPLKSGYDLFFGNYGGAVDYFTHKTGVVPAAPDGLYEGEVPVDKVGYYTDLIADRAVDYIGTQKKGDPFFLSLHFTAPHWPWEGPHDAEVANEIKTLFHYDGGSLETYAKMVESLDAAVGRVLQKLQKQGLEKDTIVIFSSDNGGERFSDTWPFSGQKTELLEGGIRVPTIFRWPRAIRAGQVSQQIAISMDWLPTLLAAAGAQPHANYPADGANLLPALFNTKSQIPRTLFWRYKANNQRAVRAGNWKYLKIAENEFLFDLTKDPRERADLKEKEPQIFAQLKTQWETWNATMLPITDEVRSHSVEGKVQADRYGA